jgi:hypothetical protein
MKAIKFDHNLEKEENHISIYVGMDATMKILLFNVLTHT